MKEQILSRRIASNEVLTTQGQLLTQQVVTLEAGFVVRVDPLEKEEARTEWLQGRVVLKQTPDGVLAYYHDKQLQ